MSDLEDGIEELNRLRVAIAIAVTVVWAVVYLAAVFSAGKINTPPELSAVMLAVVTWLFGGEALRHFKIERRNGNGNGAAPKA